MVPSVGGRLVEWRVPLSIRVPFLAHVKKGMRADVHHPPFLGTAPPKSGSINVVKLWVQAGDSNNTPPPANISLLGCRLRLDKMMWHLDMTAMPPSI